MAEGRHPWQQGLCLLLITLAAPASGGDEAGVREQELNQLRGRIGELQSGLDSAQGKRQAQERELQTVESQIGAITRRLRELDRDLTEQRRQLKELEQGRDRQERELALHRGALIDQIRAAYAMGRQERLKIMLNQQDPAVVSRVMVYYDYFNRARSQKLELIAGLIAQLRETEARTLDGQTHLLALQERELEQKKQLEQAGAARQLVLKDIQQEIRNKGQELAGLKKDEQKLQELMARLQREAEQREAEQRAAEQREAAQQEAERRKAPQRTLAENQKAPFNKRKGAMAWPTEGRLAASFGQERAGGLRWDGVFIAAPEGAEVQAIHGGRVVFADWLRGFGLLLIIDHGGGYMSLYGHNQSLFKAAGDSVAQGEAVALVGSSGGQSNAGVYFGIRHQGRPVNPQAWCQASKGNKVGMQWPRLGPSMLQSEVASEAAQAAES